MMTSGNAGRRHVRAGRKGPHNGWKAPPVLALRQTTTLCFDTSDLMASEVDTREILWQGSSTV
jgi:hypothetical protein